MRLCEIKSQERKGRCGCSLCLSHRTRELLWHIILASQTYRFSAGYSRDREAGKRGSYTWLGSRRLFVRGKGREKKDTGKGRPVDPGEIKIILSAQLTPSSPFPLSSFSRFSSLSSFDTQESGSSHRAFLSSEFHPLSGFLLGCAIPLYPLISGPAPTFN